MNLSTVLYSPSIRFLLLLVEKAWNALRFATTALRKEHRLKFS